MASSYSGDFKAGDRVDMDLFTGTSTTGAPTVVTAGSACVIKRTSGTPAAGSVATGGVQMTSSGAMHFVTIFTGSDSTYYAAGADYQVFWGFGSIGATDIVGYPIGHFSIQNRTLNWGSVSAPTTTQNLSGTTVGTISAIAANAVSASAVAADACNEIADAILLRDVATGSSASTTRSVQAAMRMIVNKSTITGSNNPYTITFYQEDDTTPVQTAAVTFSANTFGISDLNPT